MTGAARPGADPAAAGATGRRCAWFHCFAGIAGDMALGSLLDAGAPLEQVLELLQRLPLRGWRLHAEPVLRGGLAATRAVVHATDDVVIRTHAHIVGLVHEARLPPRVERRALATFAALAEVEGRLHRRPPSQVHFHEVGAHDTIIDVVGTAAALEVLDVDDITASAIATGTGTIRSAHGLLPNPSPAVVALLQGVPTWGRDVRIELTTPTGAALLAATASGYGPLPAMRVEASGFGAGQAELPDLPNCTQVVIGVRQPATADPGQPVVLLQANVDDVTGETLAHATEVLLDAGALDAWITPIVMKKGRPAHTVSVLADPALTDQLRRLLQSETGSFGVRAATLQRWASARRVEQVEYEGASLRVKVSAGRAKVEHADAARLAAQTGRPLREVVAGAEAAWRRRHDAAGDPTPPEGRTDAGASQPTAGDRVAGHRTAGVGDEVDVPAPGGDLAGDPGGSDGDDRGGGGPAGVPPPWPSPA